jgi:pantoate--beta-alanine ligase
MHIIHSIDELTQQIQIWKQARLTIGFVPTMGNLHAGHLQLVDKAKSLADKIIVSIFVNPLQFGINEDFAHYPRTETEDIQQLAIANVDALFLPSIDSLYPIPIQTQIHFPDLEFLHCGQFRPGHFSGVATIVSKLFHLIPADFAIFGDKDFQQLTIIRTMVRDLNFAIKIISVATVREADGLAMSSRNRYLTSEQRPLAAQLYQQLLTTQQQIVAGERCYSQLEQQANQKLTSLGFAVDYFHICRQTDLLPAEESDSELVILLAAKLAQCRLIDNIQFKIKMLKVDSL